MNSIATTRAPADAAALADGDAGALAGRVRELERIYRHVETTRMAGLGVTHSKLRVAAVGFEPEPAGGAAGVLVTPWFMNLVWLPAAQPDPAAPQPVLGVGHSRARHFGNAVIDFLGAHEEGFGAFETCSLFSPMFDFVDQEAAVATAQEVLKLLRQPPQAAAEAAAEAPATTAEAAARADAATSRRAFLLGARAV